VRKPEQVTAQVLTDVDDDDGLYFTAVSYTMED
jgi:hypothetical protein